MGVPRQPAERPFVRFGGRMGAMVAELDWAATPLGPIEGWPRSLRTAVGICLASRHPMVIWWGPELILIYNDAWVPILGPSKHPALGLPAAVVWPEHWHIVGAQMQGVRDSGEATWSQDQLLPCDRHGYLEEAYFTYSYSPIVDEAGEVGGVFTTVTETTERVLGERRLRTLRQLGEISAVTAPMVEQACAAALEVLGCNRADIPFAAIYLLDGDGGTARRVSYYGILDDPRIAPLELDPERDAERPLWAVLDEGRPHVIIGLAQRFPGLFAPTGNPMGDAEPDTTVAIPLATPGGGAPIGVLATGVSPYRALDEEYQRFLDLVAGQVSSAIADAQTHQSVRRRAEELAELDRARTEFFAGVSHELRTPLTLITAPAEDSLADEKDPLTPRQRTRMELIRRGSGRLHRLVDSLLEFARTEAGGLKPERAPVDLSALTRGIAQSFAPAVTRAGLTLQVHCADLGSAVSVDVDMWEKVVLNLLSNAVKYTLDGTVTVALDTADDGAPRLVVADTGIGIAEHELPLLFQRFHRVRGAQGRSHEGSGIGLALVTELVELHDGAVRVHSTPGEGTTFTVTLPASARTDAAPLGVAAGEAARLYREEALQWSRPAPESDVGNQAGGTVEPGPTQTATVLIAEDNPDLRRFLAGLLSPGYTVMLATDGRDALDRVRERRPDLVLADVMMPRMDGFELLAALRTEPATVTTPVILLSARAGEAAAAEGLAAGADDYLVKPFAPQDLLARVRSNLAMARLRTREGAWRTALVNSLQDAFFVTDAAEDAIVEMNPAMRELFGLDREQLPIRMPYPFLPTEEEDPDEYAAMLDLRLKYRAAGHGRFVVPLRHARTRARMLVSMSFSALYDQDRDRHLYVVTARDVSAQRRVADRDRLLAEISRVLDQPAGLLDRLGELVRAAAPVFADLAMVSLPVPDGRRVFAVAAHRTRPELADLVRTLWPHQIPEDLVERYRVGRAFVLPELDERLVQQIAAQADVDTYRTVPTGPVLVAPMLTAGRLLGSLTFVGTEAPVNFDAEDLALAEELARRVAAAVEADRIAVRERQLRECTAALAAAGSLPEAAAALAACLVEALDALGVAIWARYPDDPRLHVMHSLGEPSEVPKAFPVLDLNAPVPVAEAAHSSNPVWLSGQRDWQARFPALAVPAAADVHALAALPMRIGGRLVGVVALSFDTEREFPPDEQKFVLTLVGQATLAFDRAAVADTRWQIARTLQHSLLPSALPSVPRLGLAAHYLPAGQHTEAGGDWYDVIELDRGRVAVAVGDVVGRGAAAAAAMGQLRSVLSGYLLDGYSPAAALERLDRFAERVGGSMGSTVLCLVLDPATGVLQSACAGHLPPLLLTAAGAEYLDGGRGCPLGVPGRPAYTEAESTLDAGATVILCTDGLVERRTEWLDTGFARLADAARAARHLAPDVLATALLSASLPESGPDDDVALVVARLMPAPLRGRVPATSDQLRPLRRALRDWAGAAGLPEPLGYDLELAFGEAVANAVEHAYPAGRPGEVDYSLTRTGDGTIEIEVTDFGAWRPERAENGNRGRGLALIRKLSTRLDLAPSPTGTRITFRL